MSQVIQISDFKGKYYVAVSDSATEKFQNVLDQQEELYLTNLMGIALRDLFIADLTNGVPTNTEYLKFFNPFQKDNSGESSKGLKETLLGLVYNDFVGGDSLKHSLTGVIKSTNENSEVLTPMEAKRFAESRRNGIVDSYNMIGDKIKELELYDYSDKIEYTFLDVI